MHHRVQRADRGVAATLLDHARRAVRSPHVGAFLALARDREESVRSCAGHRGELRGGHPARRLCRPRSSCGARRRFFLLVRGGLVLGRGRRHLTPSVSVHARRVTLKVGFSLPARKGASGDPCQDDHARPCDAPPRPAKEVATRRGGRACVRQSPNMSCIRLSKKIADEMARLRLPPTHSASEIQSLHTAWLQRRGRGAELDEC